MKYPKPDITYWNKKLLAYFHDPIDKVFDIQGHEERGKKIIEEVFGGQPANEDFWKTADRIASGFERGQVPSYSKDDNENGAIDFINNPIITHPISKGGNLKINFNNSIKPEKLFDETLEFLKKHVGNKPDKGYSEHYKNDPEGFAFASFLFSHLAMRFKLSEENIGGLVALWHRLPADSRFPDHSIWQHNGLVSALNSCMELGGGSKNNIGLMVVSITPVQGFIAKARKLRDYWTGSVILSWLAFEGIRWVIENLGCDHILYPSLVDQPLINNYLQDVWSLYKVNPLNDKDDIASFPNKFLFLAPFNRLDDIASDIKEAINNSWSGLTGMVRDDLTDKFADLTDDEKNMITDIFERQTKNFWDINWAASKFLTKENENDIKMLLPEKSYINNIEIINIFNEIIKDKENYDKSGIGLMYSASHSLVQTALASSKIHKVIKRQEEPGEKCQMCGEFEVINTFEYKEGIEALKYKNNIKGLWEKIKIVYGNYDFTGNEKLCTVCLTKRLAGKVIKKNKDHILNKTFNELYKNETEGFPSTTFIALHDYFEKNNITDKWEKLKISQEIHNKEDIQVDNRDRYYAILIMDGDKMGNLVNGENIASTWNSIMHPVIATRLKNNNFESKYRDNWKKIFDDEKMKNRLLTPAIHSAISESLGDFAIYGVARIVKKYDGALIYAGGDDVVAMMPVSKVLKTAKEIREYYHSEFRLINEKNSDIPKEINGDYNIEKGKLSINLGKGDNISISAGVLICHHKESLSLMIERTHELLKNKAKNESGRNAIAVELKKRSGGLRQFYDKWDSDRFKVFCEIGEKIGDKNKQEISKSLVYRLNSFKVGFDAMLGHKDKDELIKKFVFKQLERSGIENNKKDEIAKDIGILSVQEKDGKKVFNPEPLIIAGFITAKGEEK